MLISGLPGAGKSTLALTMAVSRPIEDIDAEYMAELRPAELPVVYFITEERPEDYYEFITALSPDSGVESATYLDGNYRIKAKELGLDKGNYRVIFSFYPMYAVATGRSSDAANRTLIDHVDDRLAAVGPCRLVVIDSLWGDYGLAATELDMGVLHDRELVAERAVFKNLCEVSHRIKVPLAMVVERDDNWQDWREFAVDIVLRLRKVDEEQNRTRRVIEVAKSRYQRSIPGYHTLQLGAGGAVVHPNGFALLEERRLLKAARREPVGRYPKAENEQFAADAAFHKFLPGIAPASATLIYGDDQTRKRLVAVRFLEPALIKPGEKKSLVVCFGPDERAFRRILTDYSSKFLGDSRDERERKLARVSIEEGPTDVSGMETFLGRLAEAFDSWDYDRVVVDDVAAIRNWEDFIPPLKRLFSLYGITSLFVHTLEREEHHRHRVMFDTIIRTKRFTRWFNDQDDPTNQDNSANATQGFTYPRAVFGRGFAYHKTKENSISPQDVAWWRVNVDFQNNISLVQHPRLVLRGSELELIGSVSRPKK
ncbi:RAD55 family ATPase [Lacipirellula parvula]|nr:hypothetical protein [Lacipirellula parvula]